MHFKTELWPDAWDKPAEESKLPSVFLPRARPLPSEFVRLSIHGAAPPTHRSQLNQWPLDVSRK